MLLLLLMTAWTQTTAQVLGDVTGDGVDFFKKEYALKAEDIIPGKTIIIKSVNNDQKGRWFGFKQNSNNENRYSSDNLTDDNYFIVEATANNAEGQFVLKRKSDGKYLTRPVTDLTTEKSQAIPLTAVNPSGNFAPADTYYPAWDTPASGQYTYLVRFVTADEKNFFNVNNSALFGPNTGTGSWTAFYVLDPEKEVVINPYPFTLSDVPTADGFAENTHWYYLKLNGRYLSYNDVLENYNYKQTNYKEQKYVYSYGSKPLTYGCFWAFVKDGEDLKIYNAATGVSMVLASDGSAERDYYPTMMASNTEGYTDSWHYKVAKNGTNFYLFLQGTKNTNNELYANNANKLNCYAGDMTSATGGNPKNYLTFSIGDGDWSYFSVEPVENIETLIEETRNNQAALTGAVGTLVSESYADFTAALNKGTIEGLVEALKIRDLTGQTVQLEPNKFYRLQNVYRTNDNGNTGKYMLGANAEGLCAEKMEDTNASLLWKIEVNAENESSVKLYHANAQKKANAIPTNKGGKGVTLSEDGAEYTMIKWSAAQYGFQIGDNYMVQFNDNLIGSWNEGGQGSDHAWYIMPAEDIKLNISDAGYATVNYPFAVQLPEKLTAYTGTANAEKSKFMLEEVPGGAVPANTPVVIEGAKGTYPLVIDYENAEEPIIRDLSGSLLPIEITSEDYILAKNKENVVGFYKTTDGGTLAQNKAYIKSTPAIQAVRGFGFSTEGDGTTGIENTVTETENEEYYDLQGLRVMNPTKGIYVTKSGKKVLFVK